MDRQHPDPYWLDVPGARLEARHVEGRRDVRLVLLHEGLGSAALWRDFPERLARATSCRVLAYSRIGYGKSDPATYPWPVDYKDREASDHLPNVLAQLHEGQRVLVGHSDGATIAAQYAARVPDPDLAGVVLIAPHFFVEDINLAGIRATVDRYETTDLRTRLARYHSDVDGVFRGWSGAWMHPAHSHWDMRAELSAIRCPVLAIQGTSDEYATLEQIDALEAGVSCPLEKLILEGVGHAPHLSRPDEVTRAIGDFLHRHVIKENGKGT